MDPENNPFKDFDPEKADQILSFAQSICKDEIDAAAHFAACLMGLCPRLEVAISMVEYVAMQEAVWKIGGTTQ